MKEQMKFHSINNDLSNMSSQASLATAKPLKLSAILSCLLLSVMCFGGLSALFAIPAKETALNEDSRNRSSKYSEKYEDFWINFKNENGSRPFGHAGGRVHFLFGKLPTMESSRRTEPSSSEAHYLRHNCGKSSQILRHPIKLEEYRTADDVTHPWLVRIVVKSNLTLEREVGVCGGVIVSPYYVITARHCYHSNYRDQSLKSYVTSGSFRQLINPEDIIPYPNYDDIYNMNDFLVIKLKEQMFRQSICLPNRDVIPRDHRKCVIAGWSGGYENPGEMEEIWVQLQHPTKCQSKYCGLKYDVNYNLCDVISGEKESQDYSDKCHGFSGSPLICMEYGRWVAYGILNWSARGCDVTKGRGYALVSTRMEWLCCHLSDVKYFDCGNIFC